MTKPAIASIAPFFIVRNVPAALSFYRDRLGFDITFQGPDPDDIFFGIVQRGGAMIMLKDVGVEPMMDCGDLSSRTPTDTCCSSAAPAARRYDPWNPRIW